MERRPNIPLNSKLLLLLMLKHIPMNILVIYIILNNHIIKIHMRRLSILSLISVFIYTIRLLNYIRIPSSLLRRRTTSQIKSFRFLHKKSENRSIHLNSHIIGFMRQINIPLHKRQCSEFTIMIFKVKFPLLEFNKSMAPRNRNISNFHIRFRSSPLNNNNHKFNNNSKYYIICSCIDIYNFNDIFFFHGDDVDSFRLSGIFSEYFKNYIRSYRFRHFESRVILPIFIDFI